jgi:glycosyltransferase involved in cell wall biosynthesis
VVGLARSVPIVDIAVIVSTFERPWHLERCLASLAEQRDVAGRFEVVVTDDGSRDDTLGLLAAWSRSSPFPLRVTTHEHGGFRLARCRNEGITASTAPYILFTDGDCILPPDHLQIHLAARRAGRVVGSDCYRFDEAASARIDLDMIRAGTFPALAAADVRRKMRGKAVRAKVYEWLRLPMLPRLSGNNIAVWRSDCERVNGFDEQFVGWGLEDRDFQQRLERVGLRVFSVLGRTAPYHLWHPPAPSFARNSIGTSNRDYFTSLASRPARCADGLVKRGSSVASTAPASHRAA